MGAEPAPRFSDLGSDHWDDLMTKGILYQTFRDRMRNKARPT